MELSYASKKIRAQKRLNVFKLVLVVLKWLVIILLINGAFYLLINPRFKLITNDIGIIIATLISILLFIVISLLDLAISCIRLNRKYKKFYMNLLKNEAMLDGLALFENENGLNDVEKNTIESYVGIENIEVLNAMSQTSSSAYFDLYQIKYEEKNYGVIIKTKIDYIDNELIVLRNDGRKGKLSFDEKNLKQYGIRLGNNEQYFGNTFALYATLDNRVYKLINNQTLEELQKFATFVKTSLCLTLLDDNLFIFIDNWKIDLVKSMFNKDGISIVDMQIEALKRLQSYIESMTLLINKMEE
ncbi:MAG: DUF3137 domain-containing protein [Erysipelotrichales bacterium]|nr:DUF3137 domain-containing protein [Erysipelotrichales bacterium]